MTFDDSKPVVAFAVKILDQGMFLVSFFSCLCYLLKVYIGQKRLPMLAKRRRHIRPDTLFLPNSIDEEERSAEVRRFSEPRFFSIWQGTRPASISLYLRGREREAMQVRAFSYVCEVVCHLVQTCIAFPQVRFFLLL